MRRTGASSRNSRCAVPADEVALFAVKSPGSIERVRRQRSIEDLLETAVQQVRGLTGFDRVMACRFRPDEAGEACI